MDAMHLDPAQLTPEQLEPGRSYGLEELQAMPIETLEELWLACPERPFYEAALKRALDDSFGTAALVGDLERLSVIEECLQYYSGQHPALPGSAPRIPVSRRADGGVQWFKVSDRIRERLAAGQPLEEPQAAPVQAKRGVLIGLGAAVLGLVLLCIAFAALRGGGNRVSAEEMTATAVELAAAPQLTPTPTLLALENLDRPIEGGEDLQAYYPVLLELVPAAGAPRVFPVQQRAVEVAEWPFEPDPDVASALLGLVVRPVLGIPYSAANAAYLAALQPGDGIRLRMSTGQSLAFRLRASQRVPRQEVAIFEQSSPGIVLVLLGEASAERLVLSGDYPPEQEALDVSGAGRAETVAQGREAQLGELSLKVLDSRASAGAGLPPDWAHLLVDIEIEVDSTLDTGALRFELLDALGRRYTPLAAEPGLLGFAPFAGRRLAAGETQQASLAFLLPAGASAPFLLVQFGEAESAHALEASPQAALDSSRLEALVLGAETTGTPARPEELVVRLRLFNPGAGALRLGPADLWVVFSPVAPEGAFPVGPAVQEGSGLLPLSLEAGEARDLELRFAWNGEAFAGLQLAGYQYLLQLR